MATDFEYVQQHPTVCSALWGIPTEDDLPSLLRDWRIPLASAKSPMSLKGLESWYAEAHKERMRPVFTVVACTHMKEDVHTRFLKLAREWMRATEKHSNLDKIVIHPAYQQIIGMGPDVIPEILKLLKREPDHWFWALRALTQGEDPAEGTTTLQAAADAWVQWGRERYDLD